MTRVMTHPNSVPSGQRRWRGQEPDDRRAARRSQLLEAGLELMGTGGVASVSMRGVCRQAKLTERYFYESFNCREELLVTVLENVAFTARDVLLSALDAAPLEPGKLVRHEVAAFTEFLVADPRRGRILFVESFAATELSYRATELISEFTTPIASVLSRADLAARSTDDTDVGMNSLAVFGALAFLYQRWLERGFDVGRGRFVEHVSLLIERIAGVSSADTNIDL